MLVIKDLTSQIKGEIKDGKEYIELALKNKADNKDLAELYYNLATEEMGHSERLHKAVVAEIDKYKASGKEVPEAMQAIWSWQHGEIIEETAEVRVMIEMFRK